MSNTSGNSVTLPPGTTISPGRETVQLGPNGQQVQGMVFNLSLQSGAQTSVFIPYTLIHDTTYVSQLFAERVAAIQNVISIGG